MGFSYNDITSKSMGLKARLTSWQVSGRLRPCTPPVQESMRYRLGADLTTGRSWFPAASSQGTAFRLFSRWRYCGVLDPVGGLKQLILDDVPDRYFMARLNAAVV